jgi:hypothetical protein
MNKKIYKYHIGLGEVSVQMHKGAKPLIIEHQHGSIHLWALVDTDEPLQTWRRFRYYATGESFIPAVEHIYINTFFTGEGHEFVWHAFELL